MAPQAELLPGTLELLMLRIEQITGGALVIEQGALYPALARLEHNGLLDAEWALSDNNRRAKFYKLTAAGRRRLKTETERWGLASLALNKALRTQEI
jgi:PadR family transcriptional regulator PadR